MGIKQSSLFGPLMFWTVLTTVFAWLPLVRIMARPEGYHWSILGLSGTSKGWDTAPRGEPATGLSSDWLIEGKLEGINPPPTQPID